MTLRGLVYCSSDHSEASCSRNTRAHPDSAAPAAATAHRLDLPAFDFEGIRLTWPFVDSQQGLLTVERSKNRKPRYIPLSDFALQTLASLTRLDGCSAVFVRDENGTPWQSFQGPLNRAKEKAR